MSGTHCRASAGWMALLCATCFGTAHADDIDNWLDRGLNVITDQPDMGISATAPSVDPTLAKLGLDALAEPLPTVEAMVSMIGASPASITLRGKKEIALNQRAAPAVVLIQGNGTCAGTLIDAEGTILTCWHCVRDLTESFVRLHPGARKNQPPRLYRAKLIRADVKTDLALLKLAESPIQAAFLKLGNEEDVQPGADVLAIGHPAGRFWSLQRGMISQVHAKYLWSPEKGIRHEAEAIQAQLPLMEGNSGGPLLSETGEIIGVNATQREGDAFAYAISLKEIRRFLNGKWSQVSIPRPQAKACVPRFTSQGRTPANDASLIYYDTDCDNKADAYIHIPDGAAQPTRLVEANTRSGKIERVRTLDRQTGSLVKLDIFGRRDRVTLVGAHAGTSAAHAAVLTTHGSE